jgi:hypothetical protein
MNMEESVMSTQNEAPVTPTPTQPSYAESAQERIAEIRAMRQIIPNLVIPESKGALRRLASAASVPRQFVDLAAVAVVNNSALVRAGSQDLAQDSDLTLYAEAYGPVADELEALASFVRHSVTKAKNKVGSGALTTYALAKRLAKQPETADLIPHVDDMSKALGRRGRKAKSQPAPTPATPVTTDPTQPSPVTATAAKTK